MATKGFPRWLLDSKDHVSKSQEWSAFIEELYEAIQQQLKESHVASFLDLTEPERNLFMERAAKAIHKGRAYSEAYSRTSVLLDQHLNNEVARQLMEEHPINTKTDLILDAAQEGITSLLRKWPDMKSKLHVCFNQPLPGSLRELTWQLYLDNTKVRRKYVDLLNNNPRAAISPQDLDISSHCEQLLLSEPTFSDLKGSIGAFYAMKAVLSYYHATKKTKARLSGMDFLLVVPFVQVALPKISRREPAPNHVVALLVEEYFTFMGSRPGYMEDSEAKHHDEGLKAFYSKVAKNIHSRSPDTSKVITDVFLPSKESIAATDGSTEALLADSVSQLVRPIVKSLFVGYVNMEVLLYIWDQYIIGLDAPGFHDEYLPAIAAIYLMLVKEKLRGSESPANLETAMRNEGLRLQVPQFQYEMQRHFLGELSSILNAESKAALPALDPTQATYPPWINWYSDRVPPHSTPQDRRRARDEREVERERIKQQEREAERKWREEEGRARRLDQEVYLSQQAEDRRRYEDDRMHLEDQLEEERKRRIQAEERANERLAAMQKEIEELRRQKSPERVKSAAPSVSPSVLTLESVISQYLIPPPPSVALSRVSPIPTPRKSLVPTRSPTPAQSPDKRTDQVIQDFLKRVSFSFNKLAHGEGKQRTDLDKETKHKIVQHKEDVKAAEREVFGRQLKPGEFDQLPQADKLIKSDQLMDVIKKLIQQRRDEDLRRGKIK